jgi:hypothetical protein
MKKKILILGAWMEFIGCRSSYDEAKHKGEVQPPPRSSPLQPQVETPTSSPGNPSVPSSPPQTEPIDSKASTPKPVVDPGSLMIPHNATEAELLKYNCKGTAVITDSGMDRNHNGLLEESEIQETRIDCTEVVHGG